MHAECKCSLGVMGRVTGDVVKRYMHTLMDDTS